MADYPYVPETITVHLGPPDSPAANVTLPFIDYIQNVASSELYPTWPENALRANIYAEVTFALNRIYTEWYRSKGYDFDITNSTAYDQAFVNGRDIFDNVAKEVNDLFDQYLSRPEFIQPLFSSYCDGRRVTCDGLSQWGTVDLAKQGLTPYEILTHYYGNNLDIRTAPVKAAVESYPGKPLQVGSVGSDVEILQSRLNRISNNYPAIPKIFPVDGIFDQRTANAVKEFQKIFNLSADGIVGPATWYKIAYVFSSVKGLGELTSEGITLQDISRKYPGVLSQGMTGEIIRVLQYYLAVLGSFYAELPVIQVDGVFGPNTREAVVAFQNYSGLTPDGIVGRDTWNALLAAYQRVLDTSGVTFDDTPLAPRSTLVLGARSEAVSELQGWLNRLSEIYPEINVIPQTGYYGELTRNAVTAFQELFGLPVTGVVNAVTWYQIALATRHLTTPPNTANASSASASGS